MLSEPFTGIFDVAGKPQKNSTFPLAGVLDCHVMLWQDYKHEDKSLGFEDLLALLVGETLAIRVPNKPNVEHRNTAPMFFTSNSPLCVARPDPQTISVSQYCHERALLHEVLEDPVAAECSRGQLPSVRAVLRYVLLAVPLMPASVGCRLITAGVGRERALANAR